jgi:hypothetical protein
MASTLRRARWRGQAEGEGGVKSWAWAGREGGAGGHRNLRCAAVHSRGCTAMRPTASMTHHQRLLSHRAARRQGHLLRRVLRPPADLEHHGVAVQPQARHVHARGHQAARVVAQVQDVAAGALRLHEGERARARGGGGVGGSGVSSLLVRICCCRHGREACWQSAAGGDSMLHAGARVDMSGAPPIHTRSCPSQVATQPLPSPQSLFTAHTLRLEVAPSTPPTPPEQPGPPPNPP